MKKLLYVFMAAMLLSITLYPVMDAAYSGLDYSSNGWATVSGGGGEITLLPTLPNARMSCELSNGTLYAVYADYNCYDNYSIFLSYSENNGLTWHRDALVYNSSGNTCILPTIAADSNDILHIAFCKMNNSNNQFDIFYTNNSGGSFTETNTTEFNGWLQRQFNDTIPAIAVDSANEVHITWQGMNMSENTGYAIFYTNSTDLSSVITIGGNSDQDCAEWTYTPEAYYYPSIAVNSTDWVYISYFTKNLSQGDYYHIGILNYNGSDDGKTSNNTILDYKNQSRNACICINSTNEIIMAFKQYNGTAHVSNASICHFTGGNLTKSFAVNTTPLKNYANDSYWIYPTVSISAKSTAEILVSAIPTLWAVSSYMEWWVYDDLTGTITANDTYNLLVGGNEPGLAIITNQKWAYYNNPHDDRGDMFIYWLNADYGMRYSFDTPESVGTSEMYTDMYNSLGTFIPLIVMLILMAIALAYIGVSWGGKH